MKHHALGTTITALFMAVCVPGAASETIVHVGVGAGVPVGRRSDSVDAGYRVNGGVQARATSRLMVGFEAWHFDGSRALAGSIDLPLTSFLARAEWVFRGEGHARLVPYASGGFGLGVTRAEIGQVYALGLGLRWYQTSRFALQFETAYLDASMEPKDEVGPLDSVEAAKPARPMVLSVQVGLSVLSRR